MPFEIYTSQRTAHPFHFYSHLYSKEIHRSPPIFAPDFLIICVIAVNNMFPKAKRFQDTGKTGKYKNCAGLLQDDRSCVRLHNIWPPTLKLAWKNADIFTFNPASKEEFSSLSWAIFPVFLFNCSTLLHSPYVSILLRIKWISFAVQESSHNLQFFVESLLYPTLLLRKEFSNCQTSVYKILVPIILIIVYQERRSFDLSNFNLG